MNSSSDFCWMPREQAPLIGLLSALAGMDAALNAFIFLPPDRRPSWHNGTALGAMVDGRGVLRGLQIGTTHDEGAVARMLSEKYGKPSKVTPMV
jgi:hypothetical protein